MELRVKNEQHAKWFGVPGNETVVKPIKIEKCFNVVRSTKRSTDCKVEALKKIIIGIAYLKLL